MKLLVVLAVSVLIGCSPVVLSPSQSPTPSLGLPLASSTSVPTPTQSLATSSVVFDGIWATSRLTRETIAATLDRNGFDAALLDEIASRDSFVDYRIYEVEIDEGRWLEYEIVDGLNFGLSWSGTYEMIDATTVVTTDDSASCSITYGLEKSADVLVMNVLSDECPNPLDIALQTVIFESAPFHLVEPADAPTPSPTPRSSPGQPPSTAPSTSRDRLTFQPADSVEGAPLGYAEYLPPDYGDGAPIPLLVFLHGYGESGDGALASLAALTATGVPELISHNQWPDDRPWVVLMPQHEDRPPSLCTEAGEIEAFLAFAIERYEIDAERVYLTGLSCGAIGAWSYLGAHTNELVAAAVLIAGNGYGAVDEAGCDLGRVPVWALHGTEDDVLALRGSVYPITYLESCTNPPPTEARLTVYPGVDHDSWTRTYDLSAGNDIYSWLLQHTNEP